MPRKTKIKRHIVLIGCSKSKKVQDTGRLRKRYRPQEMYGGQLFRAGVYYAESRGLPWAVLSSRYGLWHPRIHQHLYDETLSDQPDADRAVWHSHVCYHLLHELYEPLEEDSSAVALKPSELLVEIHAGKHYSHPLAEMLQLVGVQVYLPLKGLGIMERLSWYKTQREKDDRLRPVFS